MKAVLNKHGATLQTLILVSTLMSAALSYGCTAPAAQVGSPAATTPTLAATAVGTAAATPTGAVGGQQLAELGCVCHVQSEEGAPSVSQVASLSASTIQQKVRQGPGQMPAWSQQDLSDQLLTEITGYLKSTTGTPAATSTAVASPGPGTPTGISATGTPIGNATAGPEAMATYDCGACHTVPGVPGATGASAPSLAHYGSQAQILGQVPNTPENTAKYIQDPSAVVPSTTMPSLNVPQNTADNMAAYLETLK